MVDIKVNVKINAPPEKVYEAVTEKKHVDEWWTKDCEIKPEVGSEARFEFNPYGDYVVVKVEKLEPNKLVEWKVTDSKMMGTEDWVDTDIIFEINENENKAKLKFSHNGFKEETECYRKCIDGWNHFINSLKKYLETGKGEPFSGKMGE